MEPLKGNAILEIDPAITFTIVDRLFGGTGEATKSQHELTSIERAAMEGVIVHILGDIRDAWLQAIDLRPGFVQIDTNPQFVQIVPSSDTVILVTLEAKVGNTEGMINLCLSSLTIKPIIGMLPTCLEMVRQDGWTLEYVPEYLKTAEMCLLAVRWEGEMLKYVPGHLRAAEICLEAVRKSGYALEHVPEHLKTTELCLEAVRKDGMAFEHVPESIKVAEICLDAAKSNGMALKYVPKELITAEMCIAA